LSGGERWREHLRLKPCGCLGFKYLPDITSPPSRFTFSLLVHLDGLARERMDLDLHSVLFDVVANAAEIPLTHDYPSESKPLPKPPAKGFSALGSGHMPSNQRRDGSQKVLKLLRSCETCDDVQVIADILPMMKCDPELRGPPSENLLDRHLIARSEHAEASSGGFGFKHQMHRALAIKRSTDLAHACAVAASVCVASRSILTLVFEEVSLLGSFHGEREYEFLIQNAQHEARCDNNFLNVNIVYI
jgi:hypothetical protein